MAALPSFEAAVVSGAGRGRRIGTPTLNLDLAAVPRELDDGIYACRARLDGEAEPRDAVMHLGERPVFRDSRTCEVHLLDGPPPETARVAVLDLAYIREVRDFPSPDALLERIAQDIAEARAILSQP